MAKSDHKAGLRPSSLSDGSPATSSSILASPGFAPIDSPYDDIGAALNVLAYLRERFKSKQWVVIPWNARGELGARMLTGEVVAALEVAVLSIEQATGRVILEPTAAA